MEFGGEQYVRELVGLRTPAESGYPDVCAVGEDPQRRGDDDDRQVLDEQFVHLDADVHQLVGRQRPGHCVQEGVQLGAGIAHSVGVLAVEVVVHGVYRACPAAYADGVVVVVLVVDGRPNWGLHRLELDLETGVTEHLLLGGELYQGLAGVAWSLLGDLTVEVPAGLLQELPRLGGVALVGVAGHHLGGLNARGDEEVGVVDVTEAALEGVYEQLAVERPNVRLVDARVADPLGAEVERVSAAVVAPAGGRNQESCVTEEGLVDLGWEAAAPAGVYLALLHGDLRRVRGPDPVDEHPVDLRRAEVVVLVCRQFVELVGLVLDELPRACADRYVTAQANKEVVVVDVLDGDAAQEVLRQQVQTQA